LRDAIGSGLFTPRDWPRGPLWFKMAQMPTGLEAGMDNFEHRRDRFDAFSQYDNPLLNLSMRLDLPDFRPWCKARGLPPFHFFLYCLLRSVGSIDNFLYRIDDDEVIRIERFSGGFTVRNDDGNLNYARFEPSDDLHECIARSVAAGAAARASRALINSGAGLSPRERKHAIYTTCMPWMDLMAIEHPVYRHREADIPLIAWGRFGEAAGAAMRVPFSVQAHHGFVDAYHIHLLGKALAAHIGAHLDGA
jgi:chloramphenicol O-acetyltransferase